MLGAARMSRTVDTLRNDVEVARRFLLECDDAVTAYVMAGYQASRQPADILAWRGILEKRDRLRIELFRLQTELHAFSRGQRPPI